jgi:hypothetical protein
MRNGGFLEHCKGKQRKDRLPRWRPSNTANGIFMVGTEMGQTHQDGDPSKKGLHFQ